MAKRSKPRKVVTTNIAKGKHKLSPIEKELLECCKNHQPVLLCGNDEIDRKDLLQNVHKSTKLTWDHVNLAWDDTSYIYNSLAYQFQGNPLEATPSDYLDDTISPHDEGYFYCCTGILFLDNLLCNAENRSVYHRLAAHIEDGNTSYKWLVVYAEKLEGLPQYFREQFKLIYLDGNKAGKLKRDKKSLETTLTYNNATGKFRFENDVSKAISSTTRAKVRGIAEKLMKWWKKGKPCPQSELIINPQRNPPQSYYDNITIIRKALKSVNINMRQCAEEAYLPPSEPKHFNIVS